MKRLIFVSLAFLVGCSGAGMGGSRFLPNGTASAPGVTPDTRHAIVPVEVRMRIPRRHRGERTPMHPATISSQTLSVSIAVNNAAARVFNATPASPNCTAGATGTTCTFKVGAPAGADTFKVKTFSGTGGTGNVLDYGVAVVNIVKGKSNSAHVTLGPVVTSTADSGTGSLRYAIGTAGPGDTIMFLLAPGATIVLSTPITISNNVGVAGPGVTASARTRGIHPRTTYTGITISGNNANQIFVVNAGGTLAVSGLILTAGKAAVAHQPGGAIYNLGTVSLVNDALTGSASVVQTVARIHSEKMHRHAGRREDGLHPHACASTFYFGGSVYNNGTLTISGTTFDGNVASSNPYPVGTNCQYGEGGAIFNDSNGVLTATNSTFVNNSAYYGGAVYNGSSSGIATFANDTFSSNTGCTATTGCPVLTCSGNGCASYPYGDGGAIYDADGPGVQISGSAFSNNVAGGVTQASLGYGGALDLETGSPIVTGSSFTSNLAGGGTSNCSGGEGGAIYENANNTLELDGDTFSNNAAGGDYYGYGGAVYNNSEADQGSGNTFTSNSAYATGSVACTNAHSGDAGGGVFYASYGITMSNSTFTSNSSTANHDAYAGVIYTGTSGAVNLSGDTFTSNKVTGTGANGATSVDSGSPAIYSDLTTRLTGNTFSGDQAIGDTSNVSEVYGDYYAGTLTSSGNTWSSNSLSAPTGPNLYGGAIWTASTFVSNGDTFKSNSASGTSSVYGGAVYVESGYTIVNATIKSNTVTATAGEAYGGGAYLDAGGTLSNSTFTGNSSSSTGFSTIYSQGGGAIANYGTATFNGLKVMQNSAAGGVGGGLWVDGTGSQAVTVNNSTFSGNTVSGAGTYGGGGAIYNYNAPVNLNNSTLSGNSAAVNGDYSGGGGWYNDDGGTATGTTFSGNQVTGTGNTSGGGGVYEYDTGTFTNVTIAGNSSALDGGGLRTYGNYTTKLYNVTVFGNTATGNGGSIYNDTSDTGLTLANTIVAKGSAGGTGADGDNAGTILSQGYNLIGAGIVGGTFAPAAGDQIGTTGSPIDPKLLALTNNGGPTFTNADQSTSPGKAAIPWTAAAGGTCGNVTGMMVDQRGFTRGAGAKCDVGAYELAGVASAFKMHVPALQSHAKHQPHPHKRPPAPAPSRRSK